MSSRVATRWFLISPASLNHKCLWWRYPYPEREHHACPWLLDVVYIWVWYQECVNILAQITCVANWYNGDFLHFVSELFWGYQLALFVCIWYWAITTTKEQFLIAQLAFCPNQNEVTEHNDDMAFFPSIPLVLAVLPLLFFTHSCTDSQ